jgi:hypothetical protein
MRLRRQLEGALQVSVAAVVVWLGLGASNVRPWNIPIGRTVRWAVLAELAAVAIAYVLVTRRGRMSVTFAALLGCFLALAVVSTAWSTDAALTLGRLATLAAVFAIGGSLAWVAAERREVVEIVILGVVAGVVVLALLGLVDLWDNYDRAVVPATTQSPARYTGIGGNPNTMAMLIALVLPAVAWLILTAPGRAQRVLAVLVFVFLYVSIVASGSRGALLGALLGTIVFAFASRRHSAAVAGTAVALFLGGVGLFALEHPAKTDRVLPYSIQPPPTPPLSSHDLQPKLPLENEVGFPRPGQKPFRRTLFTSSGRLDAWRGALDQALERPLLGYGFGTEERVFVDRYYLHYSDRPENAYVGTLLQLGLVGLAALVALLAYVLSRARLVTRGPAAACAGAVVCGLVLAVTQSYLTSVGSPAMTPFWLCAFLLVGATELQQRQRDEREEDAAERHAEAGLDVVRRQDDGVEREQHDRAATRAAAPERER